jgi:hypothetical protein
MFPRPVFPLSCDFCKSQTSFWAIGGSLDRKSYFRVMAQPRLGLPIPACGTKAPFSYFPGSMVGGGRGHDRIIRTTQALWNNYVMHVGIQVISITSLQRSYRSKSLAWHGMPARVRSYGRGYRFFPSFPSIKGRRTKSSGLLFKTGANVENKEPRGEHQASRTLRIHGLCPHPRGGLPTERTDGGMRPKGYPMGSKGDHGPCTAPTVGMCMYDRSG